MSRLRRPLLALAKDLIIGMIILGLFILAWRVLREAGLELIALSPVEPEWFITSWLKTSVSVIFLFSLILILGRGCQSLFGKHLAATPGFRRLTRSGELLITELSLKESRGFKVVLVKLTPEENRQVAILTSVLDDADTGRKLATVFVPGTPNVRVGETRILPFDDITITDWTVSDAISFLMSGGTVSPTKIHFTTNAPD